ncbi:MAG: glutathione peroxidase [Bdellovibrionales bacterium]|nr:glutathione peroxidase [Bdellovibrionales bacterium]
MKIYDFEVRDIDGNLTTLKPFQGKVLLIVNVASACGLTPQYEGLEALYQKFKGRGFVVLGFPCNQFGGQEPGSEAEIKEFCSTKFNVSFPLFSKIEVNGPGTHPLFQFLKKEATGVLGSESIKWNFTKFLVDRNGRVADRVAPTTTPESIEKSVDTLLGS